MGSIADMFATPPATGAAPAFKPVPPVDSGHTGSGAFGFLGNLVGDVKDFVVGLEGLASQGLHDVGRVAGQGLDAVLPGKNNINLGIVNSADPSGYHLDNIGEALVGYNQPGHPGFHPQQSAIVKDYANRYGGLSNIEHGLYTHPLSYFFDALGVGSLASSGAKLVGKAALSASPELASAVATTAEGLKLADVASKPAGLAALQSGLETLGKAGDLSPLQSLAQKILPSATLKRIGAEVPTLVQGTEIANPVTRGIVSALTKGVEHLPGEAKTLLSEPVQKSVDLLSQVKTELAAITDKMPEGVAGPVNMSPQQGALEAQKVNLEHFIAQAQSAGMDKVGSPLMGHLTLANKVRHTLMGLSSGAYGRRDAALAPVENLLHPYYKADPAFDAASVGIANQIGVHIADAVAGGIPIDFAAQGIEVASPVAGTPLLANGVAASLSDVTPTVRAAAEMNAPHIVEAFDQFKTAIQGWLDNKTPEWFAKNTTTPEAEAAKVAAKIDARARGVEVLLDPEAKPGGARAVDAAREELRILTDSWNQKRLDTLPRETAVGQFNRSYRDMVLAHGGSYKDGVVLDAAGNPADFAAYDNALRGAGVAPPVYFPMQSTEKAPSHFDFLLSKNRIGNVARSADKHMLQNKGNLLASGKWDTNLMSSYVHRAAQSWKAEEAYKFSEVMRTTFGRKMAHPNDFIPGAEAIIAPEGTWRMFTTHTNANDTVAKLIDLGMSNDQSTIAALKQGLFRNQDEIISSGITKKGLEMWAVPKNVGDQIDAYARWSMNNPVLRLAYDKPMDVWRSFVLGGSPRWTINNTLSNVIFQGIGTGSNRMAIKLMEEKFMAWAKDTKTGDGTSLLDHMNQIPGVEVQTSSGFTRAGMQGVHLGSAEKTAAGKFYSKFANTASAPKRAASWWTSLNTAANGGIEDAYRQASFLTSLEKQLSLTDTKRSWKMFQSSQRRIENLFSRKGDVTEGMVKAAITDMNHTMGNYAALSPFERNVVRRFFVPFWSYYKHQGRVLITLPFEHPMKTELINALESANKEFMAAYGALPDYLQGGAPMGLPGAQVPFLTTRGVQPFGPSFENPLNALSPLIKIPYEMTQHKSVFTGQPFTDPNVVQPYGSDQAFRIVRDAQGNIIDEVPVAPSNPGILQHLLSQFPQYMAVETALAGGRPYDTSTLIDALRARLGGAPAAVQAKGVTQSPKTGGAVLGALAGLPSTNVYDIGKYQDFLTTQRKAALAEAMRRAGLTPTGQPLPAGG